MIEEVEVAVEEVEEHHEEHHVVVEGEAHEEVGVVPEEVLKQSSYEPVDNSAKPALFLTPSRNLIAILVSLSHVVKRTCLSLRI